MHARPKLPPSRLGPLAGLLLALPLACASPSSAPQSKEAPGQPLTEAAGAAGADQDEAAPGGAAPSGAVVAEDLSDAEDPSAPSPAPPDDDADAATARPRSAKKAEESKSKDSSAANLEVAVPALNGGLNRDIIRRKVVDRLDEVRSCYGRGLDASADLGGALVVSVEYDGDGRVTETSLGKQNAVMNRKVQDCVLEVIDGWEFGAPDDGKPGSAELSFTLQ